MLTGFFLHLKAHKLPVSTRELLTLLEALEKRVVSQSIDDFYMLSRACFVKDEQHFDRFDLAFATYFKNVNAIFDIRAEIPEEWLKQGIPALPVGRGQEAGGGAGRLGQADGDAEEAARGTARPAPGRLEVDRHRRHQSRSAPTATTRRAFASGRTAAARAARSRSGTSGRSATWMATSSSTRATSRWRCAGCGASRAKACRRNSTSTAPSTARRATPAGST